LNWEQSSPSTCALPWIDLVGEQFERVRALIADSAEGALAAPTTPGSVGWGLFSDRELIVQTTSRVRPGRNRVIERHLLRAVKPVE